jgi:hypothetical protein
MVTAIQHLARTFLIFVAPVYFLFGFWVNAFASSLRLMRRLNLASGRGTIRLAKRHTPVDRAPSSLPTLTGTARPRTGSGQQDFDALGDGEGIPSVFKRRARKIRVLQMFGLKGPGVEIVSASILLRRDQPF